MNALRLSAVVLVLHTTFAHAQFEMLREVLRDRTWSVEAARENNMASTKNYCVDFWGRPDRAEALSKIATLSEQCECVQGEMRYMVSDELAVKVMNLQTQNREGLGYTLLSEAEVKDAAMDWTDKWHTANKACGEKFLRRRRMSR